MAKTSVAPIAANCPPRIDLCSQRSIRGAAVSWEVRLTCPPLWYNLWSPHSRVCVERADMSSMTETVRARMFAEMPPPVLAVVLVAGRRRRTSQTEQHRHAERIENSGRGRKP